MLLSFDDVGLTWQPEKIRTCLQTLNGLVDAKYLSSPILSERVRKIGWRTVAFDAY
ncbi:hypothetical protein AWB68_01615 [Caballeronia choica]|uniref:Uncharacterized protein n=1 Tax=Caballeronia choica TaxID=326476 RepID=A0A158GY41_9BURK|nr:hypothetical protein [Caballeronia choica]SAL37025.1 hypothetical protein AWB68_01615 [Caballeronia choica]